MGIMGMGIKGGFYVRHGTKGNPTKEVAIGEWPAGAVVPFGAGADTAGCGKVQGY